MKRQRRKSEDGEPEVNPYVVTCGDMELYAGSYKKDADKAYKTAVSWSASANSLAFYGKRVVLTIEGKESKVHPGFAAIEDKAPEEISALLTEYRKTNTDSCVLCEGTEIHNCAPVMNGPDVEVERRCLSCGFEWIEDHAFELARRKE